MALLIAEQRHSPGSEEITFNGCFSGSLMGTEPTEVLSIEQALDPSSLEFHRAVTFQCCQVRQVCFGADRQEKSLWSTTFCRYVADLFKMDLGGVPFSL